MDRQEFINKFMPNGNGNEGLKIREESWLSKERYYIPIAVGIDQFLYVDNDGDELKGHIDETWELYEPEEKKYCNWKKVDCGNWDEYDSGCGKEFGYIRDTCPSCGLEVREEKQIKGFTFDGEVNCPSVFEGEVTGDITIKKDIKDTNLFSGNVNGIKYLGEELLDKLELLTERVNKLEVNYLVNESRKEGC